ncbi:FAD-dependent oxidoreductase [Mumia sp. zg.B17]|uniref:NAD(P)/FAD-dependent oxidoreductase n=1 Tax=Mumia sp. zg.B17 TaxID=2855446 RepID=UPI001C6EAEDC|nr:FAD-dependent oxidoreductase [Mumia sp. zg.B17]MBW9206633.1 FAD-dependent oxidoreductase [Mumia sp. zg.B17]
MSDETYVVVGGGLAGGSAAATLREEGFDGAVVLVTVEDRPPYERPVLSKGYMLGSEKESSAYLHDSGWWSDHDIDLRTETMVTGVRLEDRVLELEGGGSLAYDKLLLATGSWPRRIEVPGADLDGVLYLRDMPEAERIRATIEAGGPLVVVGAGWIGLEIAAAARANGVAVTVVETAALPLRRVLGDRVAEIFASLHRHHGVDLRLGSGVTEIRGDGGSVTSVVTSEGEEVPAAAVVVAIGAAPQSDWGQAAGLSGDPGIDTDPSLRTSDVAVWAAGDIAAVDNPRLGRRVRVEHWAMAHDSGPVAARSMLGQDVTFDKLPFFFTDQYDLGMEYVGHVEDVDETEVVVRGDADPAGPLAFQAFWLRDGVVQAAMHVNMWDDGVDPLEALVGRRVDAGRLGDRGVPLADL